MSETEAVTTEEVTKPTPKPRKTKAPAEVRYSSREKEASLFAINGINGQRASDGRAFWMVPAKETKNFEDHWHVVRGRVIKD